MITKLFYNEDDGNIMIINLSYNEGAYDDVISISYSYIKFITLFKYLTLYHISYFESYLYYLIKYFIDSPLPRRQIRLFNNFFNT